MNWYAKRHGGAQGLRQRRPPDRHHCVGDRITHQRDSLAEKKDLCIMAGLRERVRVEEWKGRFGRIIRAPSALHQHLHVCLMTAVLIGRLAASRTARHWRTAAGYSVDALDCRRIVVAAPFVLIDTIASRGASTKRVVDVAELIRSAAGGAGHAQTRGANTYRGCSSASAGHARPAGRPRRTCRPTSRAIGAT